MKPQEWGHDPLAEDLARHLAGPRRMIWCNMQLGPAGSPRPDVYCLDKSFVRPSPTAYEVKISISDFRADVTAGKWQAYLDYAGAVFFAAPAGLLSVKEIPPMCGLIVRHEVAWRLAKKATPVPRIIAQDALIKLLIDGIEREGPRQRAKHWHDHDHTREFGAKFGSTAARWVADAASVQQDLERAQERQRSILERADKDAAALRERAMLSMPLEWHALLKVLELPAGSDEWAVHRAIADLKRQQRGGEEGVALRQIITMLRRIVQNHEHLEDPKPTCQELEIPA
jgi:hypothetical protein